MQTIKFTEMTNALNRIKAVLAERGKTGKWLAEQVDRDPATVSKWCTNSAQPDLLMLAKIANLLDVDLRELLVSGRPLVSNGVLESNQ